MMRHALEFALCCVAWLWWASVAAQPAHQHGAAEPALPSARAVAPPAMSAKACRKGAFTDAMALINASVRASRNLAETGNAKSTVAMAELDSIVGIAIEQASAEFDCVKGTLVLGYDRNFADTAKLAWQHAKARKMSPSHIQQAQRLITTIELAGAPTASTAIAAGKAKN